MKNLRRIGLPLLLAGLLAALAGQYYFSQVRDRFWDGVFFYAIAVVCFLRLLALRPAAPDDKTPSFWQRLWPTIKSHPFRAWAGVAALFCAYTAMRLNENGKNWQAVVFWLLGLTAAVGMWVGLRQEPAEGPPAGETAPPSLGERLFQGLRGVPFQSWEILAVVGCTVLALLVRLVRLGTVPYVLSGDEASMGIEAVKVLEGQLTNPFATGWLSHPTLYFFMLAGSIRLLGQNIWGLRLLSPFAGAAAVPVLYLLARRLFTRRVALAAMVLLTFSHLSIHFSRLGINNIYDPLFGLVAFFFLVRGLQEGRILDFALSGAALALAQFFYMGARLLPVMVGVFLVLWWALHPGRKLSLPLAALGSSFLLAGAPLFRFFLTHWDDFAARIKIVGIIQSGWLESEAQKTGLSQIALLLEQLRKSLLAFNYTVDPTSWYAAKTPYLDFVSGLFFVLGLVVVLRYWRKVGALLTNVWFLLCLFVGGMLVENPPSSPRFVIFMPAVVLIAAVGLAALLDMAGKLTHLPRPWLNRVLLVVLLVAALLNVGYYFLDYTPSGLFGGLNTEVGTRIGEYLRAQETGSQVYFFGPTRMWIHYATIPYLAPGILLADVEQPVSAPVTLTLGLQETLFIFLPERTGELTWVQATYPQGLVQTMYGHEKKPLFVVYRVTGSK